MKRNALLLLCILLTTVYSHAAGWVRQDIDALCTFSFPARPQVSDGMGMKNFLYHSDLVTCMVQVKPTAANIPVHDSTTLAVFYDGAVKGILRGANGKLIRKVPVLTSGLQALELEYSAGGNGQPSVTVCSRILLLYGYMMVYTFSSPAGSYPLQKDVRDRFFGSLSMSKDMPAIQYKEWTDSAQRAAALAPYTTAPAPDSASTAAIRSTHTELVKPNTVYFIISFAGCMLLLSGLLYIIVRMRKKKQ